MQMKNNTAKKNDVKIGSKARPEDDLQGSKHVVVILTYIIIVVLAEIYMLFVINLMIFTQRGEFY